MGSAFWMYFLLPGVSSLCCVCSLNSGVASLRVRMLSRVFKLPTLLGILAFAGTRGCCTCSDTALTSQPPRVWWWSDRSKLIVLEAVSISYTGIASMLSAGARGVAKRAVVRARSSLGRCLGFLPHLATGCCRWLR